ncbi:MAG: hypothetical protein MJE12_09090 [Alphaproteobacteria bacterium]|nr:hypothetical protein [Alphaproteobacteria bacterium]
MTVRFGMPILIAALGFVVVVMANVAVAADSRTSSDLRIIATDQGDATVRRPVYSASEDFADPE